MNYGILWKKKTGNGKRSDKGTVEHTYESITVSHNERDTREYLRRNQEVWGHESKNKVS